MESSRYTNNFAPTLPIGKLDPERLSNLLKDIQVISYNYLRCDLRQVTFPLCIRAVVKMEEHEAWHAVSHSNWKLLLRGSQNNALETWQLCSGARSSGVRKETPLAVVGRAAR